MEKVSRVGIAASSRVVQMIAALRGLLKQQSCNGVSLSIADDGYVEEGGWVYLIVTPDTPGIRAYEYVERLNDLEAELRKVVGDNDVTVVPAVPD